MVTRKPQCFVVHSSVMSRAHGVISQEYHSQGGVETMNNTFTLAIEMDWREGDQIGFCSDPNELSSSL